MMMNPIPAKLPAHLITRPGRHETSRRQIISSMHLRRRSLDASQRGSELGCCGCRSP